MREEEYSRCKICVVYAYLLSKRTSTPVYHENKRSRPRGLFSSHGVNLTRRITFAHNIIGITSISIAKVAVCIINILCNGTTVGRQTEECLSMVISFIFYEILWRLSCVSISQRQTRIVDMTRVCCWMRERRMFVIQLQ